MALELMEEIYTFMNIIKEASHDEQHFTCLACRRKIVFNEKSWNKGKVDFSRHALVHPNERDVFVLRRLPTLIAPHVSGKGQYTSCKICPWGHNRLKSPRRDLRIHFLSAHIHPPGAGKKTAGNSSINV